MSVYIQSAEWLGSVILLTSIRFQICHFKKCSNRKADVHNSEYMMTSSNGIIFCVTGHLCGEFTGHRFLHKGQWRGALMLSLICDWINPWVNNGEAGDLRRHRTHNDVTVMIFSEHAIMNFTLFREDTRIRSIITQHVSFHATALAHWDRDKMAAIFQTTFKKHF